MPLYQLQPHQASRGGGWRGIIVSLYQLQPHQASRGGEWRGWVEGVSGGGGWRGWVEGVGGGGGNCFPYIRIFVKLTS